MLKGFVSGEEKDIVRIPMKGKNLFDDATATYGKYINSEGVETVSSTGETNHSDYIPVYGNTSYTIAATKPTYNSITSAISWYDANKTFIIRSSYAVPGVAGRFSWTAESPNNAAFAIINFQRYPNYDGENDMLNLGSAPLPYEPYGYQEGWEVRDNQDRLIWGREDELQTATGTLPFKGYALPVKVKSLLGNAVQNGTPAPSPVNPNLVDPSATVPGYQESDGDIHTPSSGNERTTDWIPFTTSALYAIVSGSNSGNINWVLYDSSKQPLYFQGPTFTPNTVITISRGSYSTAAYVRISWTNAANQPICVTTEQRSEYIAFDPNPPGPVIPEMCGVLNENLAIIENESYSLSNQYYKDTRLTDNLEAGTYTISFITGSTSSGAPSGGSIGTGSTYGYTKDATWFTRAPVGDMTTVQVTLLERACIWARFVRTGAQLTCDISVSKIRVEEGSTAYGWKVPFENHGENLLSVKDGTQTINDVVWTASHGIITAQGTTTAVSESDAVIVYDGVFTRSGNYINYCKIQASKSIKPPAGTYAFSANANPSDNNRIALIVGDDDTYFANGTARKIAVGETFSVNGSEYVMLVVSSYISLSQYNFANIMLNAGSTPKPYSPYLNATIPVYLGEVPTVRRVKKLVLTGQEDGWSEQTTNTFRIHDKVNDAICPANGSNGISNMYTQVQYGFINSMSDGQFTYAKPVGTYTRLAFKNTSCADVTAWKAHLQQQYQNGTPLTIWYALNEPETTISNEPLCKIFTYADELTTIQAHGLSAPLYGIGDYKDTLNLSTGVVTRKVKKLVFDGTEAWSKAGSGVSTFYYTNVQTPMQSSSAVCSHFELAMFSSSNYIRIYDRTEAFQDVDDFQSYLAAQYQAGTPVTVWYVLNTPTTETVTVPTGMTGEIEGYLTQVSTPSPTNRSVPKWNGVEETGGTYAVTVYTPPEIPTTTGQNTLTVETEKIHGLTNPLCGIGDYKDVLNLSTGVITRKIKKLVLDGTETGWTLTVAADVNVAQISLQPVGLVSAAGNPYICSTHYIGKYANEDLICRILGDGGVLRFYDDTNAANVDDWKAYLASEYAAGHPVTVWYVLSTPETETITVPYGLECSVEGYLTQSGTPTPSSPITPDSNGILESGGTYAVEVSLVPSNLTVKGHIKELT